MAQVSKISSFKSFTEVKNQEATMKLREENNAKRQETIGKIGAILDEMGLTSLSELDEDKKQALIDKMFGNVSEDEAEDIEDELNKLGKPKKLEEGNAFIYAAAKAKNAGKKTFQFNGKTYKVTLKTDTGLREGNSVEESVNEAKKYSFTFDYNTDPDDIEYIENLLKRAKVNAYAEKGTFDDEMVVIAGDAIELRKAKKAIQDDGFEINESTVNEGRSIAKIQYDWSKLTTQMQATAQNWKAAEGAAKESLLGKLKEMTAQKKALEAELDAAIADKDKDLELVVTESKEADEASNILDDILGERDMEEVHGMSMEDALETVKSYGHNGPKAKKIAEELWGMCNEAFNRLPKDVIGTELYAANQNLQSFYSRVSAGNDVDPKDLDAIIKLLQQVKSLTKKFNNKEEVLGTVYEAQYFKSTKNFIDFLEEIDGMPEHRIRRIMGKDYIDTPGGFRDEADDYDNDIEEYTRSNMGNKDFEKLRTWWENNVQESQVNEGDMQAQVKKNCIDRLSQFFRVPASKLMKFKFDGTDDVREYTHALNATSYEGAEQYYKIAIEMAKDELGIKESSELNEADMTKFYDGFIVFDQKNQKTYKFKYVKGTSNVKVENDAIDKLMKATHQSRANFGVRGFIKKGQWNSDETEVFESLVNEGAAKQFEVDFDNMVKNIKSGYGWIDPEYVGDTWENSSDSVDFEIVKAEIYKRLIAAGLLAFADDEDEETAGQYVKSLKELGIKESVVTEAEIKSDDEFKEYAMAVLKKAFGDEFDEAKAGEVVDGILKKCGDDYGACVGMLTGSLGESVTNEAFDANKRVIELDKLLKKQKFIGAVYPEGDTIRVFVDSGDTGTTMMWDDDEPGKVRMECEDDSYSETIDDNNDAILNFFSDLDDELDESVTNEAFDANYWEDYHEDAPKITNPSGMQIQQEVEAAVEEWNDNNEDGEENEVTPAGEKKVLALAKQFAKAKGYICHDVIDAMIAQES